MTRKTSPERPLAGTAGLLGLMVVFGAPWLVNALPSADAQTHARSHAKPKSSAAPSQSGAPAASATGATAGSGVVATSPAANGPVPAPRVEPGADGVRLSPLNPAAEEMPGSAAALAGSATAAPSIPAFDYDKLLGDIAALRARVADVGDALFVSRIVLALETDGDHAKIGHLTIELDDGVVYTAPADFRAVDLTTVYEHAVAPGHHAVTVDVDRKDDRDDTFRDAQRTRFIVDVPKDQRLEVTLRVGDDSNMGANFPGDHHGKYDLRVRMKAAASPVKR